MKAMVYTEYGAPDVLRPQEVAKPSPQDNELLIRNRATSVNYGDIVARKFSKISMREFNMPLPFWFFARLVFGWRKPKNPILGSEFAGVVEAVGKAVTRFKVGDEVFGYRGQDMGAAAEYMCMAQEGAVALKPANMSFEEAAVVPYGAITALNLLRKVDIQPGDKVLINGASGSIGAAAVQFLKQSGAHVTGVCGAPRLAFVKALGADKVIDYRREDFTQNGEKYDLIFDILGRGSLAKAKRSLKADGQYLLASFKMRHLLHAAWSSIAGGPKVICALAPEKSGDLPYIKELIEAGQFKAEIDQCFPLEQLAEAHRYVEQGDKKGQIAIVVR